MCLMYRNPPFPAKNAVLPRLAALTNQCFAATKVLAIVVAGFIILFRCQVQPSGTAATVSRTWPVEGAIGFAAVNDDLAAVQRAWDVAQTPEQARAQASDALSLASMAGNVQMVEWLLSHGADPNTRTHAGRTALINVADAPAGCRIARLLIDAGGDLNVVDKRGNTALIEATRAGDTDLVRMLLSAGAESETPAKDDASSDHENAALVIRRSNTQPRSAQTPVAMR
jgi:hypothetical protein